MSRALSFDSSVSHFGASWPRTRVFPSMLSDYAESLQSQAKALKRKASELAATKRKEQKVERRQRVKCCRQLEKHEDIGAILLAKHGADFGLLREYFAKNVEDERGPEDFVHRVSEKFLAMSDADVAACLEDRRKGSGAKLAAERFCWTSRCTIGLESSTRRRAWPRVLATFCGRLKTHAELCNDAARLSNSGSRLSTEPTSGSIFFGDAGGCETRKSRTTSWSPWSRRALRQGPVSNDQRTPSSRQT